MRLVLTLPQRGLYWCVPNDKVGFGLRTWTGMRFLGWFCLENGDRDEDEDRDEVFAAGESAADQLVPLRRASLAFG